MPSSYLSPDEYDDYGLPAATTLAQIQQSSILVDAHLQRPEGLVYLTDSDGNPVCMSAQPASGTFLAAAGISIGTNVTVTLSGPLQTLRVGAPLVADKADSAKREMLIVGAVSGSSVTFARVTKSHSAGVSLEAGLFISDAKHLPAGRMQCLLSRTPVAQILSAQGRFASGRRGRYPVGEDGQMTLQGIVNVYFAQPGGTVENINVAQIDFIPDTGQVWLPAGLYQGAYTDINVSYLAGFTEKNIPSVIKQAVANLVSSQARSPMAGNIKVFKSGDTQIERFLSSLMSQDEMAALKPYAAKAYA